MAGLVGLNIFFVIKYMQLQKRLSVFFSGKNADDLELIMSAQIKKLHKTVDDVKDINSTIEVMQSGIKKSLQKVGVVRFNPFRDIGGDQSFSVALLDEKNDGLVLSSLFTREGTRIYTKPIEKGVSTYKLTDEESEAINKALSNE